MPAPFSAPPTENPPALLGHFNRRLLQSGILADWIREGRIVGAAIDPVRFAHDVALDAAYETDFRRLAARGDDAATLYQGLILEDAVAALELFRACYDGNAGRCGHVSIGITPGLERDTAKALAEAERLWHIVDRPNAMISVPGVARMRPVIEGALRRGVNIEAANLADESSIRICIGAYALALTHRLGKQLPVDRLAMILRLGASPDLAATARLADFAADQLNTNEWRALRDRGAPLPRVACVFQGEGKREVGVGVLRVLFPEQLGQDADLSAAETVQPAESGQVAGDDLDEAEESFATWMHLIESRRERIEQEATTPGQTGRLGAFEEAIHDRLDDLEQTDAVRRLWKDASAPGSWRNVTKLMKPHLDDLAAFGDEVAGAGFSHVLLLGRSDVVAGAEVLRRTNIPIWGHPELLVLDSLVPATIRRFTSAIDPKTTLVVVAEAGGESVEAEALYAYFYGFLKSQVGGDVGSHFVAITDPGSALEAEAIKNGFRRVFRNPPGMGPADSALSFPGMVPAALMGLDVATLLGRAEGAVDSTRPSTPIEQNPGATLGAALGALARLGRKTLTLVCPAPIEAFGLLIEPLVTARHLGIRPIVGEPLGSPAVYGNDRVFVQIRTVDGRNTAADAALNRLADAGHPVITHILADTLDLHAEFFRWQVATALAEPTYESAPREVESTPPLTPEPLVSDGGLTLAADPKNAAAIRAVGTTDRERFVSALAAYVSLVRPGDCVAIVSYFDEREVRDVSLDMIRATLRDVLHAATTTGYAARSRYGSGVFSEAAPETTVLLQLYAVEGDDLTLPDQPLTFGTLNTAFALRDYQAIASRGGRALRIALGTDVDRALATLRERIGEAVEGLRFAP